MKKIIVGIFAVALLFVGSTAFASGPFNGQDGDCPGIGIGNYTTGVGIADGQWNCWTSTSASATSGQVINVGVFYHNNTNSTLTNVRASLSQSSTGPGTSFSFTGNLSSDQGSTSLGTVNLTLNTSQTVTFNSAYLYKGKSNVDNNVSTQFPSGSSPTNLSIGSVPSGWNDYGYVVYVFRVGTDNNNNQTCQDPAANNYGSTGQCTYNNNNTCTISNFTVNGSNNAYIQSGNTANLVWNTNNCTSATVTGLGVTFNGTSGSQPVYPTYSGDYTLTAYGQNGNPSQTVHVNVNNNNNNTYCTISNFTVNPTYVTAGSPATLYWNTNNCTSATVSGNGVSFNGPSGSQIIYPTYSGNYTLSAYGQNGNPSQTIYVNVQQVVQPPVINSCAVTTVATNITQTSAILNGLLTGSTGASYFEYGTTVNLGLRTPARVGNGAFSESVTGLSSDTPYYFRFVSQCSGGLSLGKIEVFSTRGVAAPVRPIIVQGTTVVGTESPIMLKIENRYQYIGVGDMVDYTVTYKNIGKSKLVNPVLQVIVPKGITLTNSSRGTYSADTNTLTVPLEDLLPGKEGVVYVQGIVNSIDSSIAQIVTTAVLVYTSPNGAQENAIAYVLNNPRGLVNNLGASAFWAGLASIGLIGWLLIIILILLIVLLTRRYYGTRSVTHTTPTGVSTTTHY